MKGAQIGHALALLGGIAVITLGLVIGLRDVEAGSPSVNCGSALASDTSDARDEARASAGDDLGDGFEAARVAQNVCSDAYSTPRWTSIGLLVAGCLLLVLPLVVWGQAWLLRRQTQRTPASATVTASAVGQQVGPTKATPDASQPPGPPPGWFQINGEWRWWDGSSWARQLAPPPPPSRQHSSSTLTGFAFVCGFVALVFLPVIFGPIGVVLGAIGASRGERAGGPAVAFALVCTAIGMYLGYQSVVSDF